MKKITRKIDVMMVGAVEVNGKMVKKIKTLTLHPNVLDFLEVSTAEAVKDLLKKKVAESRVFLNYDLDELWYKWDNFLDEWRNQRRIYLKQKKVQEEINEIDTIFPELDINSSMTPEMKKAFLTQWHLYTSQLEKQPRNSSVTISATSPNVA